MRFLVKSLIGLAITALTVALLALALAQIWRAVADRGDGGRQRPAAEQVFTARLLTIRPVTLTPVTEVFGRVQARRRLELRAGTGGRIVMLDPAMHEGGAVRQDQLLVQIDPAPARAARDTQLAAQDAATAALQDAQIAVGIATADLAAAQEQQSLRQAAQQRQRDLAGRGLGTSAEREAAELAVSTGEQAVLTRRSALAQAESAVTSAQNDLRRIAIALAEAERELQLTEIRARFDGRVTEVTAVEGGLVSANEKLADLIDPAALEVAVTLSLQEFARLTGDGGQLQDRRAVVRVPGGAGGGDLPATLDRAAASVAEGEAGRTVYAALDSQANALRPGDFVTLAIQEPPLAGVAQIPAAAVGGDGAVLVAGAEGRLTAVPVTVLRRQGDDVIISVAEDLDGARIVAERSPQLGTGIMVREAAGPESRAPTAGNPQAPKATAATEGVARPGAPGQGGDG